MIINPAREDPQMEKEFKGSRMRNLVQGCTYPPLFDNHSFLMLKKSYARGLSGSIFHHIAAPCEATVLVMFSTFSYHFMAIKKDYKDDYGCLVLPFTCSSWDCSWRGSTLSKEEGLGKVANLLFSTLFLIVSLWVCPSILSFMLKIWILRESLVFQTPHFPKALFHPGDNIVESCPEDWLVAIELLLQKLIWAKAHFLEREIWSWKSAHKEKEKNDHINNPETKSGFRGAVQICCQKDRPCSACFCESPGNPMIRLIMGGGGSLSVGKGMPVLRGIFRRKKNLDFANSVLPSSPLTDSGKPELGSGGALHSDSHKQKIERALLKSKFRVSKNLCFSLSWRIF